MQNNILGHLQLRHSPIFSKKGQKGELKVDKYRIGIQIKVKQQQIMKSIQIQNKMQRPGLIRIIQWVLAIPLIVGTVLSWRFNAAGQNIINITACLMLIVGIDNILVYYRCYKQKSAYEAEGTFIIFCLFILGIIFQNFNKSYGSNIVVNLICKYSVIAVLILNVSYYAFVLLILIAYLIRQIYRLMTQTLLSATTVIDRNHLQRFLNQNRENFRQVQNKVPSVNTSCSICLLEFQPMDRCVVVPSCQHCFHDQCISQWLNTKSTCPYCRHNIQLDILLDTDSNN